MSKVYILYNGADTMMEGYSSEVEGVFSTLELAQQALRKLIDISSYKTWEKHNDSYYKYYYDGTYTETLEIQEVNLDTLIHFEGI